MIKVVKGNVVLRVEDELLDYYVDRGYTAKRLDGTVIKEAVPTDIASLKKVYVESKKELKALKEENADLKKQIIELKSQIDTANRPIVSEEKPKKTRKKLIEEE